MDLPTSIATAAPPADAPSAKDPEQGTVASQVASHDLGPTFHSCGGTFVHGWCDTCGDRRPDPRDHVEVDLGIVAGAVSDKGLRHRHNEDGFAIEVRPDETVLAVVCDGVSSTVLPEEASKAASDAAIARLRVDPTSFVDAHADALAAVRRIEWTPKPGLGSPSCTFLAATISGPVIRLAGLGDCRAYWVPTLGEASILTSDDSWAQDQATAGVMTLAEAMTDRRAHVITRWLGQDANDEWRPREHQVEVVQDGLLVLCSDGLWNYLDTPAALTVQVAKAGPDSSPVAIARHLVQFALDAGGHDNITVHCIPAKAAT